MNEDRLDKELRSLGDRLTQNLQPPPYEVIDRRRIRYRRTHGSAVSLGIFALVGAVVVGVGSVLSGGGPNAPSELRPMDALTVSVSPAVPGELSLRDVSFVDDQSNVLLGQRCGLDGQCDTVVLSGKDGAKTFGDERVVTPAGVVGPTKVALGVGSMLIAYDPGLYLSGDGGRSWQTLAPGYSIMDIATRGTTFTALGISSDGHAELLEVPAGDLGIGSFTHIPIDGADASARLQQDEDGTDLVVAGSDGSALPTRILVRPAGSSGWTKVTPPGRCASPSFAAPAQTSWWLVCAEAPNASGDRVKTAYFSPDRGKTWRTLTPPPFAGSGGTVTAVSRLQAYLSGPDSALYVTYDGGDSWRQAIARTSAGFGQPHVSQGMTWVVSGSSIWRLLPGGAWQQTLLS